MFKTRLEKGRVHFAFLGFEVSQNSFMHTCLEAFKGEINNGPVHSRPVLIGIE
jgi:hypothetical protein